MGIGAHEARRAPAAVLHGRRDARHLQRAREDPRLADHRRGALDPVDAGRDLARGDGEREVDPAAEPEVERGALEGVGGQPARQAHERRVARLREVLGERDRAGRPALEVAERPAADVDRRRARDGPARAEAVAQQRGRADDLERRPGRVAAAERAVERGVGGPVGDREHVARRGSDRDERGRTVAVAERGLGRGLDVAVERRAQRPARRAGPAAQRAVRRAVGEADDDLARRRPRELLLVARLEAELPDLRARAVGRAEPLELLRGDRADGAEQRAREAPRRRELGGVLDRLHALDRLERGPLRREVVRAQLDGLDELSRAGVADRLRVRGGVDVDDLRDGGGGRVDVLDAIARDPDPHDRPGGHERAAAAVEDRRALRPVDRRPEPRRGGQRRVDEPRVPDDLPARVGVAVERGAGRVREAAELRDLPCQPQPGAGAVVAGLRHVEPPTRGASRRRAHGGWPPAPSRRRRGASSTARRRDRRRATTTRRTHRPRRGRSARRRGRAGGTHRRRRPPPRRAGPPAPHPARGAGARVGRAGDGWPAACERARHSSRRAGRLAPSRRAARYGSSRSRSRPPRARESGSKSGADAQR